MISRPIPYTRFVPLAFTGQSPDLINMSNALKTSSNKPLVIFLTRRPLEFAKQQNLPISPKIIKLPPGRIPSGPEYAEIKRTVFEYLSSKNESLIGICSSKGDDICLYVAARWIIEESCIDPIKVLDDIRMAFPPGIQKRKYLMSLSEIYDVNIIPPEPEIPEMMPDDMDIPPQQMPGPQPPYQMPNMPYQNSTQQMPYRPPVGMPPQQGFYRPPPPMNYGYQPNFRGPPFQRSISGVNQYNSRPPPIPPRQNSLPLSDIGPGFAPSPVNYGDQPREKYMRPGQMMGYGPNPGSNLPQKSNSYRHISPPPYQRSPIDSGHPLSSDSSSVYDGFLSFTVRADDSKLHREFVSDFQDPIIMSVGQAVTPQEEKEVRSELSSYLGMKNCELRQFSQLNKGTFFKLNNENLYCFMQQPNGKRCYLFARGTQVFVVGEGLMRTVRCFMPENSNSQQSLILSVFEGVLYRETNSSRVKFVICDCIMFESQKLATHSFANRFFYADQVYNDTKRLVESGSDLVKGNELEFDLRYYNRLKYIRHFVKQKNPMTKGFIFTQKVGIFSKSVPTYFFCEEEKPYVTLRIRVEGDDCYGVLSDNTKVAQFNMVTDALIKANGSIVDIEYDFDLMQWSLKRISNNEIPMNLMEFIKIREAVKLGPMTEDDLIQTIEQINSLTQYVEEELAKQKAKSGR